MAQFFGDAAKIGYRFLKDSAQQIVIDRAKESVKAETHRWIWDPEVEDVIGLVRMENSNKAVIIIYLKDDDFEVDEDWLYFSRRRRDSGPVASTGEEREDAARRS